MHMCALISLINDVLYAEMCLGQTEHIFTWPTISLTAVPDSRVRSQAGVNISGQQKYEDSRWRMKSGNKPRSVTGDEDIARSRRKPDVGQVTGADDHSAVLLYCAEL